MTLNADIELISARIKEAHRVHLDPTVKLKWQDLHRMLGCSYGPPSRGGGMGSYHSIYCGSPNWIIWRPRWIPATIYPLGFILLKCLCDVHFTDLNPRFNSCENNVHKRPPIQMPWKSRGYEKLTPPHSLFLRKCSINEEKSIEGPPNWGRNPTFPLCYSARLIKVIDPQKTGISYFWKSIFSPDHDSIK